MKRLRRLLGKVDDQLHSWVAPWFASFPFLAALLGGIERVRRWVGGTWTFYYDEYMLGNRWEHYPGRRERSSIVYPITLRGTPYIEHHLPR